MKFLSPQKYFAWISIKAALTDSSILVNMVSSWQLWRTGEEWQPSQSRIHTWKALCWAAVPPRWETRPWFGFFFSERKREREIRVHPSCVGTRSADLDIANPNTDAPLLPSCGEQKETQCVQEAGADKGINPMTTNATIPGTSLGRKKQQKRNIKMHHYVRNKITEFVFKWLLFNSRSTPVFFLFHKISPTGNLSISQLSSASSPLLVFTSFLCLPVFPPPSPHRLGSRSEPVNICLRERAAETEMRLSSYEPPAVPDCYGHQ